MWCFSSMEWNGDLLKPVKGINWWEFSIGQSCVLSSKLEVSTSKSGLGVAQDNAIVTTALGFPSFLSLYAKIQRSFLLVLYSVRNLSRLMRIPLIQEERVMFYLWGFSSEVYYLSLKHKQCLLGLNQKHSFKMYPSVLFKALQWDFLLHTLYLSLVWSYFLCPSGLFGL